MYRDEKKDIRRDELSEMISSLDLSHCEEKKISDRKEIRKDYKEKKVDLKNEYKERKTDNQDSHQSKREHREQKELLKNDYREQKQELKYIKETSMTNVKGRIKNHMSGLLRGVVIGLLIMFQIFIIIYLPAILRQYTVYFYLVLEILSFFVAVGLTNASKNASFKVAWLSIALLLPVSGHIMYYRWGRKKTRQRMHENARDRIAESYPYYYENEELTGKLINTEPRVKKITKYISSTKTPLFSNTKMKYYSMGDYVFNDMFRDLFNAKKFIFVNFFIVAEGALWDIFHELLLAKAKEGVKVIFIYDDFGAMLRTDKHFADNLNKEGIRTIVFNPIKKYTDKLIMNYRTHQKIVVIDGEVGYTGGFNIADEYANLVERFGVWKDCGIRLEGEGVWGLSMTFMQMWSMCCPEETMHYVKYKTEKKFPVNDSFCHILADGPVYSEENMIGSVYKQIIAGADDYVYIMTPYLILEEHMILTMIEAVKRGVDVRIITPAIPDKKIVKLLTNYNYGALLAGGIKIYEYTPGFIHSKVIMNECCGVVGTVNMDYRSFYLHYENGVWLCNDDVLKDIYDDFMYTFEQSREYKYDEWIDRPFAYKLVQPVLNLFSTLT